MGVPWILIAVGIIAVIIVSKLIHFKHFRHKISAILLIVLVLFLYATITAVIKINNIDIKTAQGILSAGKIYLSWLGQAFGNLKSLTGSAIQMDWLPKNVSLAGSFG